MNKTKPLIQGIITIRENNGYSMNCAKCGEMCVVNDKVNIGKSIPNSKIYHEECLDSLYV